MSIKDEQTIIEVSVEEIKRDTEIFLHRIETGQKIILTKKGIPVAQIEPISSRHKKVRPYGLCAGQFTVPEDFDEPLPDNIINTFSEK